MARYEITTDDTWSPDQADAAAENYVGKHRNSRADAWMRNYRRTENRQPLFDVLATHPEYCRCPYCR